MVGVIQTILVDIILLIGLNIEVASIPMFFLTSSFAFMEFIQMLVTMLGDPGRFLAIMTYSVQSFKAVISSGDVAYIWHNNIILLAYLVGFMLVTLGYFKVQIKRQIMATDADKVV